MTGAYIGKSINRISSATDLPFGGLVRFEHHPSGSNGCPYDRDAPWRRIKV